MFIFTFKSRFLTSNVWTYVNLSKSFPFKECVWTDLSLKTIITWSWGYFPVKETPVIGFLTDSLRTKYLLFAKLKRVVWPRESEIKKESPTLLNDTSIG